MRLLPTSLLGRVYALYAITLGLMAVSMVALFAFMNVRSAVLDTRADSKALLDMVSPVMAESVVIGDYDTVHRLLERLAHGSTVAEATFVDRKGAGMRHEHHSADSWAPAWMEARMSDALGSVAHRIAAGGKDYGEVTLVLDAAPIATHVVQQFLASLGLGLAMLALGLWQTRRYLTEWLGHLDRMADLGARLEGASPEAQKAIADDAPEEFKQAFDALNRAAGQVQAQRERATATLEAIDDAVLNCDVDGNILLANQAASALFQAVPEALMGEPMAALVPALEQPVWLRAMQTGWSHRRMEWKDPDGRARVLETNLTPIQDATGQRLGHVLACRDVTEADKRELELLELNAERDAALAQLRRALEQFHGATPDERGAIADISAVSLLVARMIAELQERSANLDAIFKLSPDGFVSFDREGFVRYASPGFTRLTGLPLEMVLGAEEVVFMHHLRSRLDKDVGQRVRTLDELASAGDAGRSAIKFAKPAARHVAVVLHRSATDTVAQMLHLRDVTRETEVDRLKSEFVAAAAHELRTPMVGIFGYAELMIEREMSPEKQKMLLQRVHRQCQVMVNILNEMLDLARLEAGGRSELALQEGNLAQMVSSMLADHVPPADRAAPLFTCVDDAVPVLMDRGKIERALRNLLSNAYKYSAGDQPVQVTVRCDGRWATVAVQDHGKGLTPEQLARVGERFYRADESGSVLGTGLGVSLVKEVAHLHGGHLELRSSPGQGTVATLCLPLTPTPTETRENSSFPRQTEEFTEG